MAKQRRLMKTYRIVATVREGIRDNQGIAVQKALSSGSLGFTNVTAVRIGKTYTMTVEDDVDIEAVAKGLINEVMENYAIEELNVISTLEVSEETSRTFALLQNMREKIKRAFAIPRSLLKK